MRDSLRIEKLEERKKRMVDYLLLKVDEEDWHVVWDAAIDIECLEQQIEILKESDEK